MDVVRTGNIPYRQQGHPVLVVTGSWSDTLMSVFWCVLQILIAYTYLEMGQDVKGQRLVAKLLEKGKREGDDILYWEGDRTSLCKYNSGDRKGR